MSACSLEGCEASLAAAGDGWVAVYCDAHAAEYLAAAEAQLEGWVAGKPEHNTRFNECCPDFSCCRPELLVPAEMRRAFQSADPQTRESMLWDFLAEMVGAPNKD